MASDMDMESTDLKTMQCVIQDNGTWGTNMERLETSKF